MLDIIIFFLGVGLSLGFAIGSVVCIVYYTSVRKQGSPKRYPNVREFLWLLVSLVSSYFLIHSVFDILTQALDRVTQALDREKEIEIVKEFEEYIDALVLYKYAFYSIITPFSGALSILIEAKATNRFIFKGFMWAIINALFVVMFSSFVSYRIAIKYDSSNLMNYGSLFLGGGAFIVTIFIASLQLKDTVEKREDTIEKRD
ncbi:hypothetical protein ACIQXF_06525 [Lysinibacillus sp. NPDC097231]|uniref:hypothetical protein n=1 Tax=Lysinibacillus sp. NPDC097231 TaxID=3364142 RepID=UPI0038144F44